MSCPCGRGMAFEACCGRWPADLAAGGAGAPDAESLMRSRYSAYVRGDVGYLQATWHASTRPAAESLRPEQGVRWLGLEVRRVTADGDRATVEFVARSKARGRPAVRLHEVSRFVREDGRWYYVDGTFR